MTRILIIGANGMLGHVLMQWQQPGITIAGTLRGETPAPFSCLRDKQLFYGVECSDTQRLLEVFEQFRPNAVVNCAGLIKHRDEAVNTAQMIATNALFPHILAGLCRAHNTRLIQISTDCIFSGAQGPYTEQHRADAGDIYGMTKYLGEINDSKNLTIRTSIIGHELQVKRSLLEWAISQRGRTITGFDGTLYSGLTTTELARVLMLVITQHPKLHGLYHVAGPAISKYALLGLMNHALSLDLTIQKDTTTLCDRRLDARKFNRATGYAPPAWEAMIEALTVDTNRHE